MTERKSTEIKFRVTPSFKARVQSAADAAGVSLTEWLENASEEKMVSLLTPVTAREGWKFREKRDGDLALEQRIHDYAEERYFGQTPPERRTEPCPHSRPPYAFCPTCDK